MVRYRTYLPKGIYGAWLLFFVSARTPATVTFTTRPAHTTTGWRELAGKTDVLSSANGPSTTSLQQRCHRTSTSARSPSWPPMPGPCPQRAAAVRPERIQPRIRNRIFIKCEIHSEMEEGHDATVFNTKRARDFYPSTLCPSQEGSRDQRSFSAGDCRPRENFAPITTLSQP